MVRDWLNGWDSGNDGKFAPPMDESEAGCKLTKLLEESKAGAEPIIE